MGQPLVFFASIINTKAINEYSQARASTWPAYLYAKLNYRDLVSFLATNERKDY